MGECDVYVSSFDDYEDDQLLLFIREFFIKNENLLLSCKKILLKPNLLQAAVPEKAITTHPLFLNAVILSLKEVTDADLFLADSPGSNFDNYDDVLEKTGISEVCGRHNVQILKVENFIPIKDNDIIYSSIVNEVDLIINLPKVKTHALTGLTLSVKNLFGLIPGTNKVSFHRNNPKDNELAESIYNYFQKLQVPMLHIIDGIIAHEGEGPSRGTPIKLGIVGCSPDAVAMDIVITELLHFDVAVCKTNEAALKLGYNRDKIKSEIDLSITIPDIKLPISTRFARVPTFIKKLVANRVHVWPFIDNNKCIGCLLCLKSCPVYAITNPVKFPIVNTKKCIECFCCYEVCESDAIFLKRSFLHKVIVR